MTWTIWLALLIPGIPAFIGALCWLALWAWTRDSMSGPK